MITIIPDFLATGALFPLAVGLGSSFTHCAGMCGPIHFFLSAKGGFGRSVWLYHAGRITGYGAIGAALGVLGKEFSGLSSNGFRMTAAILIAALYALFGLGLLRWLPAGMNLETRLGFLFPARMFARLSSRLSDNGRERDTHGHVANRAGNSGRALLFPAGLMASLLPCPSTHAVMLWSLGLGEAWKSALAMVLLGMGTLPVFAVISRGAGARPAWAGRFYQGMLGAAFLGLSAWRIYGITRHGTASCH